MEWPTATILGSVLLVVAVGLIAWHVSDRRKQRQADFAPRERDYRRRQFRRRMQVGVMVGLVGLGILLGSWLDGTEHPNLFVYVWVGTMGLILWIILLAAGDMAATGAFFAEQRRQQLIQTAKLRAELERLRGKPQTSKETPPRNGTG